MALTPDRACVRPMPFGVAFAAVPVQVCFRSRRDAERRDDGEKSELVWRGSRRQQEGSRVREEAFLQEERLNCSIFSWLAKGEGEGEVGGETLLKVLHAVDVRPLTLCC